MNTYYKSSKGIICFYTSAQIAQGLTKDMTPLTPQEVQEHLHPIVPFPEQQQSKLDEINTAFSQAATALTEGYPEEERLTWPVQQSEALAWGADPDAPTPYLDGLAAARGITPQEMRNLTLQQVYLFMAGSQALVGKRQKLRDQVYAAQTSADLDEIHWDAPSEQE